MTRNLSQYRPWPINDFCLILPDFLFSGGFLPLRRKEKKTHTVFMARLLLELISRYYWSWAVCKHWGLATPLIYLTKTLVSAGNVSSPSSVLANSVLGPEKTVRSTLLIMCHWENWVSHFYRLLQNVTVKAISIMMVLFLNTVTTKLQLFRRWYKHNDLAIWCLILM